MTAVNSLIALVVCSVVGAFTGLVLGGLVGHLSLAIIAGLLATIIAGILRNIKLSQLTVIYDALTIERGIPLRLIIYSAIATLVGGIAAVGVTNMSGTQLVDSARSTVWALRGNPDADANVPRRAAGPLVDIRSRRFIVSM